MKTKLFFAVFLASALFASAPAEAFLFWNSPKKDDSKETAPPVVSAPETAPSDLTLMEAYALALKKSETVALSAEEINQAQARFYRSFDYFLPTVDWELSRFSQDATGSTGSTGTTSDATRRNTPLSKFTFTQPIFSGFKELAAIQATGADKQQQVLNLQRAKELLFVDVMSAYYAVLEAERNIQTLTATHQFGANRLKELDGRIRVGRSRETEKQTSLADLKLVEANLVQARSLLKVSRNLLEFYIGDPLGGRNLTDEDIPHELFDASLSLQKSVKRSDVQAAEQGYIVAEKGVIAAQADLFLKIYAKGNLYTHRVGFQSDNNWDVTVQMDVPVFEVGKTLGDIKEAVATRETEKLKWSQARRMADLDVRDALEDLRVTRLYERALWQVKNASKQSYDLVSKDYSFNLVNNLDVLDALRRLQDNELSYNDAYFKMKESYWKFKVAVGEILSADQKASTDKA